MVLTGCPASFQAEGTVCAESMCPPGLCKLDAQQELDITEDWRREEQDRRLNMSQDQRGKGLERHTQQVPNLISGHVSLKQNQKPSVKSPE